MVNLFSEDNLINPADLNLLMLNNLRHAIQGKKEQFFYNLDLYLDELPQTKSNFVQKGLNRLQDLAQQYNWKKADELFDNTNEDYVALFHALEEFVHVGIDMTKEDKPTALFTRNLDLLKALYANGQLEGNLETIESNLTGTKTANGLKEGVYTTVRLDTVSNVNNHTVYKAVVPRSNMSIGAGKDFVIIPVHFFHYFEQLMQEYFSDTPFRFIKESVIGPVAYSSAISDGIVRTIYAGSDVNLVNSKVTKLKPHYDYTRQRYFVHDVEASLTSLGIVSFRPEMLNSITPIALTDIDKSKHNINFTLLRGIFKTRISQAKLEQLDSLNMLNPGSYATVKDKADAIITLAEEKTDRDLYHIMSTNPDVFGDLEEGLASREKVQPRFMKNFKTVTLPNTLQERTEVIKDMLTKGVIRVTANTTKGRVIERYGSNNPTVLSRMLGKDYIRDFESIRYRLYYIREQIESGVLTQIPDLERAGVEYSILDYLDTSLYLSGDPQDAITTINDAITQLKLKASTRKQAEGAILYRDIYASPGDNFYGQVNAGNVIAVDFSPLQD